MSDAVSAAVAALNDRLGGAGIDGSLRIVIAGEGAVMIDPAGVRAADEKADDEADCTLSADADTFRDMLEGALDPTTAFMSGRLSVAGDMGLAMKFATLLA